MVSRSWAEASCSLGIVLLLVVPKGAPASSWNTHMQSNVTTTINLLCGSPGSSAWLVQPQHASLLHQSLASLALSPNHLTCLSDVFRCTLSHLPMTLVSTCSNLHTFFPFPTFPDFDIYRPKAEWLFGGHRVMLHVLC